MDSQHFSLRVALCTAVRLALAVGVISSLLTHGVEGRTWYIKPDGSGDAPTIQAGIDSSEAGDDVLLAPGVYDWLSQESAWPAMVRMKPGVWLHSEAGAHATTLDGLDQGRLILCENVGMARIEGLRFTRGHGVCCPDKPQPQGATTSDLFRGYGGAIYAFGNSELIVEDCVFERNRAEGTPSRGGAVACSVASFFDCEFVDNWALMLDGVGGAVYGEMVQIDGCEFRGNLSIGDGVSRGGAVRANVVEINNSSFEGNSTGAHRFALGGAIWSNNATITACEFVSNSVSSDIGDAAGGAVHAFNGSVTGGLFVDNSASSSFFARTLGGAVRSSGTFTISSSIFVGNSAGGGTQAGLGGAASLESGLVEQSTFYANDAPGGVGGIVLNQGTVRAVLLAFTTGQACGGTQAATWTCCDLFANAEGNGICGSDGGGNFSADPQFCAVDPTASLSFGLQVDSPCAPGNHPPCGLIGAVGVSCGTVHVQTKSWAEVKSLFR